MVQSKFDLDARFERYYFFLFQICSGYMSDDIIITVFFACKFMGCQPIEYHVNLLIFRRRFLLSSPLATHSPTRARLELLCPLYVSPSVSPHTWRSPVRSSRRSGPINVSVHSLTTRSTNPIWFLMNYIF